MGQVFDSDVPAPGDRLSAVNELFAENSHPMGIDSGVEDFRASKRMAHLAAVNVVELHVSPSRVVRTARTVRRKDPELVSVGMAGRGKCWSRR